MTIALIGSGNAFFKDEGAGLYAAKYLKENYAFEPSIEIVDGGTLGFRLMPLLQEFDYVVIVNTSSDDSKSPGTVIVQNADDLVSQSGTKKTANEVEISEMLQICSMASHVAETTIISMVPEDLISVSVDLTPTVRSAWDGYIAAVLSELSRLGVRSLPSPKRVDIDAILHEFANPSIEHGRGF